MAEDEHQLDGMIALLPITTNWSTLSLPHLTLAYLGKVTDLRMNDFNEIAKTCSLIAAEYRPITLLTAGVDVFGPEGDHVEVIRFRPNPLLLQMQRRVSAWHKSEFPFNPHSTIGPLGSLASSLQGVIPGMIAFDRIMIGWGDDQMNFWLRP